MKTYGRKSYNRWQHKVQPAPLSVSQKVVQWSGEQALIFAWFATGLINGEMFKNLVIVARAGTGKTSTLIEGFKHIPQSFGKILYGVFNRKNYLEAESKITDPRVTVKTWHGLGFYFLMQSWGKLRANGWIERERVQRVCPEFPAQVLHVATGIISKMKNKFLLAEMTLENVRDTMLAHDLELFGEHKIWNEKLPQIVLDAIKLSLTREPDGRISYDDMVFLPVALNMVSSIYDFSVGDEGQDLNRPQFEMLIKATKPEGRIALVGDDRQQMYTFRGAMHDCLGIFRERLNAGELSLKTTYRCPKSVVALAKDIVPDYEVWSEAPDGETISLPYEKIVETAKPGDAILSRVNAPLMRVCLKLLRAKIRANIEGKDVGYDLLRIIKSFEAKDISELFTKLEAWQSTIIANAKGKYATQKIETCQDQYETINALALECKDISEMETKLKALFELDSEYASPSASKVTCSSVHKAKGLEWSNVFVFTDTFNSGRAKTAEQVKEEQNIYYVALTRSQHRLYMTTSGKS